MAALPRVRRIIQGANDPVPVGMTDCLWSDAAWLKPCLTRTSSRPQSHPAKASNHQLRLFRYGWSRIL